MVKEKGKRKKEKGKGKKERGLDFLGKRYVS